MSTLDRIAASGNSQYDEAGNRVIPNRIVCADGFSLSVIAGSGNYCTPRPALGGFTFGSNAPSDYPGPYTEVEVGFPSARPEPWGTWEQYVDDPEAPTETVYGYVPVETVRALIDLHGGEAARCDDCHGTVQAVSIGLGCACRINQDVEASRCTCGPKAGERDDD
ncbi:hypothetical protein OG432_24690 [Streptomyces sp. NBC_00442]|uniref:hypothetical protein n=1 Tax=Streptomyces sp. NBC_00442 TaxID=2903651 RepID=UPI002E1B2EF2